MNQTTTRRTLMIRLGAGAGVMAGMTLIPSTAFAEGNGYEEILAQLGAEGASDAKITVDAPEIAENGNTVPIGITVDSPMTADDHVKKVTFLASGNPQPGVATFHFTPMSGEATASTRIRLAGTQNIIAVAEMSNGEVYAAQTEVKVTIGGCGG